MSDRIAILDGCRTPFVKAGGRFAGLPADDLGAVVVRELLARAPRCLPPVDEVVFGNVAQPVHAPNVARVLALKAGLPETTVAQTVHRNCASGMQALTAAALELACGRRDVVVAGGTESMSGIPLLFGRRLTRLFIDLMRARTLGRRLRTIAGFRPAHLRPVIALELALTDPVCGLNMGQTAEVLAREFGIGRRAQDEFALDSHRKALDAAAAGRLAEEIVAVVTPPEYRHVCGDDDGPDAELDLDRLARRRPYFDRGAGTVTAGNACPVTDGAAAVLMVRESTARRLGLEPLGYLRDWAYAGLDGRRMGLGPVYAAARLFEATGDEVRDYDLVEINEAFAAQVLANLAAFSSRRFARDQLGRTTALGAIEPERLNVNGGAVALGHPVGATGTRLVLTVLRELRRRGGGRGLATLCVGGGQGAALSLEAA